MARTRLHSEVKYKMLAEQMRRQIQKGALRPGDRLPSFSEMRVQFGATPTTVQRVYALLERDALIVREHGRGVFVASPQSPPLTGVIGVTGLQDDFAPHPWDRHLMGGAREAARKAQKEFLLLHRGSAIQWEKVDGVLNFEPAPERVLPLLPPGIPFVSALMMIKNHASIVVDEAGGVREAMEYLLKLGHRRIAYLIATPEATFLRPRVAAYQDALRDANIRPNKRWLRRLKFVPSYWESGWRNMTQWLAEDWSSLGCTALLVQNDDIAIGVMQALQQAGIHVPRDVSVIGFDGTEIGEYCTPHLTSVQAPLREVGKRAVETLLEQMNEEEPSSQSEFPATLVLPTQLVVRASTAPPKFD